jgi:hypothetical protein
MSTSRRLKTPSPTRSGWGSVLSRDVAAPPIACCAMKLTYAIRRGDMALKGVVTKRVAKQLSSGANVERYGCGRVDS